MREVMTHLVHGKLDTVRVFPEGDPTAGGAPAVYRLAIGMPGQETGTSVLLKFQNGDPRDGANGITNEALLAVVADRLQEFQKGKFSCRENAIALTHIETALLWLQRRTQERLSRGVEGTTNV